MLLLMSSEDGEVPYFMAITGEAQLLALFQGGFGSREGFFFFFFWQRHLSPVGYLGA